MPTKKLQSSECVRACVFTLYMWEKSACVRLCTCVSILYRCNFTKNCANDCSVITFSDWRVGEFWNQTHRLSFQIPHSAKWASGEG